jgi:hypothetical protein
MTWWALLTSQSRALSASTGLGRSGCQSFGDRWLVTTRLPALNLWQISS